MKHLPLYCYGKRRTKTTLQQFKSLKGSVERLSTIYQSLTRKNRNSSNVARSQLQS
jgi:tRNA 2-selenouridine synthase SelU